MSIVLPNGYKMISTFFTDFRIAEEGGIEAVKETFNIAFKGWKHNHVYLTELAIVMSNYSCMHYDTNKELSMTYAELYRKVDEYCMEHLKKDELAFYIKATD